MINRYERQVMKDLWSEKNRYDSFLAVELAASYAWHKLGLFSNDTYQLLTQAHYQIEDIKRIEQEVKHDVIAFTKAVSLSLGDEKKYLHYGLTSTDVVDTAQSLILRDVNQVIRKDLKQMMQVLKDKAHLYKDIPCMGRTHGIHAEVTSFGLKFALWYEDFKRISIVFENAAKQVEVAKLSGAVGNYSANTPELEQIASKKLGLQAATISTQTLQRDRHASYMSALALIAGQLEKMAVEIRHLSRTEVQEVSEYFDVNQKGSSAMPHKKNPISSENISGLARVVKGYMLTAFENIALWHERDISHSSVERIILPDATTLIDYMLTRYTKTLDMLIVKPEQMLKNIGITQGVVFAQSVLHELIDHGMNREQAYDLVQKLAHKSLCLKNKAMMDALNEQELDHAFDLNKYLKYTDQIFSKVFAQ